MQYTTKVEVLAIDKTDLLTKVALGRKWLNNSVKKVEVEKQANIIIIVVDTKNFIISWDVKKVWFLRSRKRKMVRTSDRLE